MRLAIPVWDKRVSPVFDSAGQLLLVDIENGGERSWRWEAIAESVPIRRARRMVELGVNVLICGGISRPLAALLGASGIRVIPWRAGPVEEVLEAYRTGRLDEARWRMPGCGGGRRRHRRGCTGFGGRTDATLDPPVPPREGRKET
ncbi:MAG: NifB/NifX family molybdenum-iron cluster-binding protein [Chloroflexi bacterium]|nr:NifB/NifX family molybdenum-iron cluster-binding protein [Chloroflexota bacterium]